MNTKYIYFFIFFIQIFSFTYISKNPIFNIKILKNNINDEKNKEELKSLLFIIIQNIQSYKNQRKISGLKLDLKLIIPPFQWQFLNNLFVSCRLRNKNIKIKYSNLIKFLNNILINETIAEDEKSCILILKFLKDYIQMIIKFEILDQILMALNNSLEENYIEYSYNQEQYQNHCNFIANRIFEKIDKTTVEDKIKQIINKIPIVIIKTNANHSILISKILKEQFKTPHTINSIDFYPVENLKNNLINLFSKKTIDQENIEITIEYLDFNNENHKNFFINYYHNNDNLIIMNRDKNGKWINETLENNEMIDICIAPKVVYNIENIKTNPFDNKTFDQKNLKKIIMTFILQDIDNLMDSLMNRIYFTSINIDGEKLLHSHHVFSLLNIFNKKSNTNFPVFVNQLKFKEE